MRRIIAIAAIFLQTATACMAEDWMGQLDDNVFLSQISIPGTHDSATGIILMDFAGTNSSGNKEVNGLELVQTIISNNQRYVPLKKASNTGINAPQGEQQGDFMRYDLTGRRTPNQPLSTKIVIEPNKKGGIAKFIR